MDVRDLILDNAPTTTATTTKRRNAPKPPEWEIVLSDAIDGAVRRKTARTSKLLVLLMSQAQFYIKDEKTGDVEELTATNLQNFLRGSSIKSPVPWCTGYFDAKADHAARFVRLIKNENFQWLAKHGIKSVAYSDGRWKWPSEYSLKTDRERLDSPIPRMVQRVCDEVIGPERMHQLAMGAMANTETEEKAQRLIGGSQYDEVKFFVDRFGLDWGRAYVRAFLNAPFVGINLPHLSTNANRMLDNNNFQTARFVEYLLCESVRQGYGQPRSSYYRSSASIDDFVRVWGDTIQMEKQTRGRVYDKYPDELDTLHRKLSFKVAIMRIDVNEFNFKEHSERLSKLCKQDASYIIRPPFNKEDMVDEATQQANCLASYISAYASNETDIYFLRRAMEPEKSHVTVEVRDGKIRQAYAACNRRPDDESIAWLAKWAEENDIEMVDIDLQCPRAV